MRRDLYALARTCLPSEMVQTVHSRMAPLVRWRQQQPWTLQTSCSPSVGPLSQAGVPPRLPKLAILAAVAAAGPLTVLAPLPTYPDFLLSRQFLVDPGWEGPREVEASRAWALRVRRANVVAIAHSPPCGPVSTLGQRALVGHRLPGP